MTKVITLIFTAYSIVQVEFWRSNFYLKKKKKKKKNQTLTKWHILKLIWSWGCYLCSLSWAGITKTSCHTKIKEPSLPNYFTHTLRKNSWIHTFPQNISAMWNVNWLVQDLNLKVKLVSYDNNSNIMNASK